MSRTLRTSAEIAGHLANLYRNEFGGKHFGKYKFPYRAALAIFDREAIRQALISEVNDYLVSIDDGYKLVQFGDEFAVFSIKYLSGLRPLPKRAWEAYASEHGVESTKV